MNTPAPPRPDSTGQSPAPAPLLELRGLAKRFTVGGGLFERPRQVDAVNALSLDIPRGATLGLVGESGSGKSTLGRLVLRLIEPDSGSILHRAEDGTATDLRSLSQAAFRAWRQRMGIVFQDPYLSLNPRRRAWEIVGEGLMIHQPASRATIRSRAAAMLQQVGVPAEALDRFPHEFSGGQRQRLAIARALILEPEFLVCDEITSALDATTQARILALLAELRQRLGLTVLFISHDLSTVAAVSDRVAVMRAGQLVEEGEPRQLFDGPQHPYTQQLLAAAPQLDPAQRSFR
jgi:ABC-type oligopeptide transport system ATPase subunit